MKRLLSMIFALVFFMGCEPKKKPIGGDTVFQRELNDKFKDASKSPLKQNDLRNFEGLEFFEFDSTYVVTAKFIRTEGEKPFKMKTTTDRLADFLKYGEIVFELKDASYTLNVYQDQEVIQQEGFEDYLFLPFLDDTNGDSSYGGGRYIDLRISKDDSMIIDFNTAYNPYCVYNEKYSCPIVPRNNYLDTEVQAGVKAYKKD